VTIRPRPAARIDSARFAAHARALASGRGQPHQEDEHDHNRAVGDRPHDLLRGWEVGAREDPEGRQVGQRARQLHDGDTEPQHEEERGAAVEVERAPPPPRMLGRQDPVEQDDYADHELRDVEGPLEASRRTWSRRICDPVMSATPTPTIATMIPAA